MNNFLNNFKVKYYCYKGLYYLTKSSDFGMALSYFDKALDIDENSVIGLTGRGTALERITRSSVGEKWVDKALDIDPVNLLALFYKGEILGDKKDHVNASIFFKKALETAKSSKNSRGKILLGDIYYELSFQYLSLDNPQKALKCIEKGEKDCPNDEKLLINKGLALNMLKEYKKAIHYFDLIISKNNPELLSFCNHHFIGKGVSLFHLKDYENALNCFNKAIEVGDNHPCGFYWKSKVLNILDNADEANKCYFEAKELASRRLNYYKGTKTIFR
ncbi:TPR repeat-containing protein YrrB [Methanobrevibacter cuticularis]|uniref:TPR repeat-containing protein YrrB n=1 Tax=Methanobrevibacter cuticularis TaxID=47311 RepID=A0A166CSR5_9EURY|nr:hypothetical protein [Methanobrevibacter cuticularis]KZX16527.1 TPR repeat-containing protein YrrB [Methanobrevibacter cuticularis]